MIQSCCIQEPKTFLSMSAKKFFMEGKTYMSIVLALIGQDSIILSADSIVGSVASVAGVGRTHRDNPVNLWAIGDNMAMAVVGDIAGYEARIANLVQSKIQNDELPNDDMNTLSERFTEFFKADWIKWIDEKQLEHFGRYYNLVEFVLASYKHDGSPIVKHIFWDNTQLVLAPKLIETSYLITGVPFTAAYWIKRTAARWMKRLDLIDLHVMSARLLKCLATFLITQSAKRHDEIGGDIQMMVIRKNTPVERVAKIEIDQLKEEIGQATIKNVNLLFKKLREQGRSD